MGYFEMVVVSKAKENQVGPNICGFIGVYPMTQFLGSKVRFTKVR
jgi:hypothetical protein